MQCRHYTCMITILLVVWHVRETWSLIRREEHMPRKTSKLHKTEALANNYGCVLLFLVTVWWWPSWLKHVDDCVTENSSRLKRCSRNRPEIYLGGAPWKSYQGFHLSTLIITRCLSVLPGNFQNLTRILSHLLPSKSFLVRESSHKTLFILRYPQAYKITYNFNIDS